MIRDSEYVCNLLYNVIALIEEEDLFKPQVENPKSGVRPTNRYEQEYQKYKEEMATTLIGKIAIAIEEQVKPKMMFEKLEK